MRANAGRTARVTAAVLALAIAFAASSCSKHGTSPVAPISQLPPLVVAESPPARSVRVPTDTAIWAQFDRPLDPATVDTRHVFLKVDTRRLPITVSYDPVTQRVLINASANLALFKTHTVEFEPGLRTADGDSLGQIYFWQFTTTSVRRPRAPYPPDSATGESPFAELLWQGTEITDGSIAYDLFTGTDSGAVAARTTLPTRLAAPQYLPVARWPQDVANYWSIRATNLNTGEQSEGPVWRFDPLPSSTPIDSVVVPMSHWSYGFTRSFTPFGYSPVCDPPYFWVGGMYDNLQRWDLSTQGPGTRLAGATINAAETYSDPSTHGMAVFSVRSTGTICVSAVMSPSDLPTKQANMANAILLQNGSRRFQSDAVAVFAESVIRHGALNATLFQAASQLYIHGDASMVLYVYRVPSPGLASSRGSRATRP